MIVRYVLMLLLSPALAACSSFVTVSEPGATVAQARGPDVAHCQYVGRIDSQTRAKVLISRNPELVQQELIDLARNQAATMGANAIVALGQPEDGTQSFNAYRC